MVSEGPFEQIFQSPDPFTNNQTEYFAVKEALERAKEGDEILSDSQLVVCQLTGIYRVKDGKLKPLHSECKKLMTEKKLRVALVKRNENLAGNLLEVTPSSLDPF